ncbi:MAG: DUF1980 domain-containing protein, partial [Verrucomicrobiota bacterium]
MKKFVEILTIIALLIWGVLFIYFHVTGRLNAFLAPEFRIWALVAGIGFCILAVARTIAFKSIPETCDHHHHHDHSHEDDGHDHS